MKCPEPSIKEPCYFCYNGECFATHWWECSKGFRKPHILYWLDTRLPYEENKIIK